MTISKAKKYWAKNHPSLNMELLLITARGVMKSIWEPKPIPMNKIPDWIVINSHVWVRREA